MTTTKKDKPKHLGRGLASLLGPITSGPAKHDNTPSATSAASKSLAESEFHVSMRHLSLDSIQPNPYQPRSSYNQSDLEDLAASIKSSGLLQPIIVRPDGPAYQLIVGQRRLLAARLAKLQTIPAIVRPATEEQMLELALVENIHRSDLNPIERGTAYKNYIETFSLTQTEAAQRLGENRSVVANYLRLLELPQHIREMLTDGRLTMGHARAILALPTDQLRRQLANRALAGRLNVREVERLVRKYLAGADKPLRKPATKPPHIADLENRLTAHLATKVTVETRKKGRQGRIIIEFYSLDDFDRLTETLGLTVGEQAAEL